MVISSFSTMTVVGQRGEGQNVRTWGELTVDVWELDHSLLGAYLVSEKDGCLTVDHQSVRYMLLSSVNL